MAIVIYSLSLLVTCFRKDTTSVLKIYIYIKIQKINNNKKKHKKITAIQHSLQLLSYQLKLTATKLISKITAIQLAKNMSDIAKKN